MFLIFRSLPSLFSFFFFLMIRRPPRSTRTEHSFPTRRSSDLPRPIRGPPRRVRRSLDARREQRSEEHTSELQSLRRTSYAVFCLKKKKPKRNKPKRRIHRRTSTRRYADRWR